MTFHGSILPVLFRNTEKYSILLFSIIIGAGVGLFFLFPLHEIARYFDLHVHEETLFNYLISRVIAIATGRTSIVLTEFWAVVGALMGAGSYFIFRRIHNNTQVIRRLRTELEKSFPVLMTQGESSVLEFKSSFRWDVKAQEINKNLENAILKTLAGFLNADGGTLLIGVADDSTILGLQEDYNILKKKNRDGFEQAIITTITHKLGPGACSSVLVMFHSFDGKDVCRLIAMPSLKPVYLKEGTLTKFYLRSGCSTRELNLQDAVEFISVRWGK